MTIRDQLNRLPSPYNELAIANVREEDLDQPAKSASDAIGNVFSWAETPQGVVFWDAVHDWAEEKLDNVRPDALPPIP